MADMTAFEQQWITALGMLVTALFVATGLPIALYWRRRLRITAIVLFILAVVAVLAKIAQWASGADG
jgi:glucan phosphoethanolaminetransferase (alkaline phosphatase superfamily)